jgi:hypothetical protein
MPEAFQPDRDTQTDPNSGKKKQKCLSPSVVHAINDLQETTHREEASCIIEEGPRSSAFNYVEVVL